ncbi:MAG: helix-turn-helix domain-containing protein [Desulfosarcinaceae bacterium]|nr:helix-turn-helix domain-containing protein [Desulfosarcinaceae bacterium]
MKAKPPHRSDRQRLTAEERREAITRAVIPVFAKKGFAATTTKDLAKASRVSEALLYRHFPSKESLFGHIQDQICSTESSIHQFVHDLEPGSESIVKMIYLIFRILFETQQAHPLGNAVYRLQIQSLLEDGVFTRTFNEPRFNQMLDHMAAFADAAIAAGEMVPGPLTHYERQWFAHHLAVSLRLAVLPPEAVFEYQSNPIDRLVHGVWFSLRGMGMKDAVIDRYLRPDKLDPLIEDVLARAGMRADPQQSLY